MDFNSGLELIKLCKDNNKKIWEIMIEREVYYTEKKYEDIFSVMMDNLAVMKSAIEKGINEEIRSVGGLVGGDAKRLRERYESQKTVSGTAMTKAVASAMAVLEINASMGRIVAAPTAGSSGILPGALISVGNDFHKNDDDLCKALFTGSAIGYIITKNATISGAEGGCQAETGSAAAMAAAAIVEMLGGTPEEAIEASAITIKNILGLVCDPVAGLVEVPCVKRNAIGTANALISADMALAGIKSVIPFDEVVDAMYKVGRALPASLKETSLGGLATTPTGIKLKKEILG